MYFLRSSFSFRPKKNYYIFQKKKYYHSRWYKKDYIQALFFWKGHLFGAFEENIIFPCIFLRKIIFHFPPKDKIKFSGKRNIIFPDNTTGKTIFQCDCFGKTIFSEYLRKISYFDALFRERSSFAFRLNIKMIFSGKIDIIFPDNTRKIIFQRDIFEKTIFSDRFFLQCPNY